ncbi:MAG: hypothetical protein FWD61_01810 [Phycisphaerales bacterium]|nr:hypothetical protein [Phycisphaerales bacterium]
MREWINKYAVYIIVVALAIAVVSYLRSGRQSKSQFLPEYTLAWYVDEETNEESVRPISELPPLPGKSGKLTVVRAIKVTYDDGQTSQTVYLEKFTPEAQERLSKLAVDDIQRDTFFGKLVRLPEPGSHWVPADSSEGTQIRDSIANSDHGTPKFFPPRKNHP